MTPKVFYDTYAIVAFLNGDKKHKEIFAANLGTTSYANLLEVYYVLLRQFGEARAQEVFPRLLSLLTDSLIEDIAPAMQLRLANRKRNLSHTDCLGYTIARRLGIPFLTGDEGFRDVKGVRFVKESA